MNKIFKIIQFIFLLQNCSPNETAESVQQGEQVCRKWDIPVPEENIGPNPKIVQLGIQELSEHGEEVNLNGY